MPTTVIHPRTIFIALLLAVVSINLHAQWMPLGPDGGDVRSVAYDPTNPDRIFIGTSAGQLFHSSDNGASWSRFTRLGGSNDYVLDNIEIDPQKPSTMYVAAWSVENQKTAGDLFRTRDGGKTWQALDFMRGKSIRAMALAASDPRIIVAGALDGVFRSRDGGDTWERMSPLNHAEIKNIESVAIDPRDPRVVYAGTWHLAWKTNDGGLTWHPIKNGVVDDSDVFSIIVDRSNSSVVYLSACSGIYKSENAGELFHKIQGMPFSARRTRVLQQDPVKMTTVYAGTTEGLWKTIDAGKTWKRMSAPNIIVNHVMVDPRRPERVLLATDRSGVLASNDGALSFSGSNRGFAHRQVSTVVADRSDANTLYVGLVNDKEFGGVFVSRNSGTQWVQSSTGLAGRDVFSLQQAENGALVAGTNRGIFLLGSNDSLWRPINTVVTEKPPKPLPKTKAKNVKSKVAKPLPPPKPEWIKTELTSRVSQIALARGKWFVATSSGLYQSLDEGKSWRGGPLMGESNFIAVQALGNTVVAATLRTVLISRDGGANWASAKVPTYVTGIHGVIVTPDAIWLATRDGAFRSTDRGDNWDHVLSGLPSRQVVFIVSDRESKRLLATSKSGELFESYDSGQSWRKSDAEWAVRAVTPVRGRLLAITAFDGVIMRRETESQASVVGAATN